MDNPRAKPAAYALAVAGALMTASTYLGWLGPYVSYIGVACIALSVLVYFSGRFVRKPKPDTDARVAFNAILARRADKSRDHLDREIHDALRQGQITAWGKLNLPGMASGAEGVIPADKWDHSEILFDEIRPQFPSTMAVPRVPRTYGPAWDYVEIRLCSRELSKVFP
jgi:hypothetical protein